ncbi:CPA2 [Mytilus coruscus]|uniref:CPA2 n=1 Tax=Mytilus coruscus TaxID=42192 RepID=A0A6J8EHA7_MYTCO|nr:CPA2 [Mytilus coruscus]
MKGVILLCVLIGTVFCKSVKEKDKTRPPRVSYRGHKLLSVKAQTPLEVEFLRELQNDPDLELDFWKQPMRGDVHIHVEPKHEKKFIQTIERAGLKYSVLQEDIQRGIDTEWQSISRHAGSRDYTQTYLDLIGVDDFLSTLAAEVPQRLERFNLGRTTIEGRQIWAVKISTDLNGSGKKAVWIECGTHAREFITISTCLATANNLARLYGGTGAAAEKATAMLDLYDWYIVPVHNPDGYDYAYWVSRLWRKNRRQNNGICFGVDLNRNWNSNFGGTGSSGQSCSDTYRGNSALSEPETAALNDAVQTTNTVAFISIHSYSQYILLPWGYQSSKPSDYNTLLRIARSAEAELESYYNTAFLVGTPPDILYVASGGAYDHMKLNNGIKYSFTYELRPGSGSSWGFELPENQIAPTIEETFASLWKFAEEIYADDNATGRK